MPCLDANVWIYYFDGTLPEHDAVSSAVRPILESHSLLTTTVVQMEVIHYIKTQLQNDSDLIERFLSVSDTVIAELPVEDVYRASELLKEHPQTGISGRDATVLAAMERYEVSELWTHDTGLERAAEQIEWLTVRDPVSVG